MKIIIIALLISLSGCVSINSGPEIDSVTVELLKDGVSTYDHVIAVMGEPRMKQSKSDGTRSAIYMHYTSKVNGLIGLGGVYKSNAQTVIFNFDAKNVLISRYSSDSSFSNQ